MRVLIVEYDPVSRSTLSEGVEGMGHEVIIAEGRDALDVFAQMKPDVVISALVAPGLDGFEFCRKVRETPGESYNYFIVLAGQGETESAIAALEGGADDCFTKPISRAEIEVRLRVATRVLSLHRQLHERKLEIERVAQELIQDGRRDPLTRVGNRQRLEEDLDALAGRSKRYGHSFCVVLCEVDEFRRYTDACGAAAGDETLRSVARTIANHSRSGDMTYRFGGHRFLIVLPEQSLDGAVIAAARRRNAVEKLALPHPGRSTGAVSISVGLAVFDPKETGSPLDTVCRRAEEAVAKVAAAGGNAVGVHREASIDIVSEVASVPPA